MLSELLHTVTPEPEVTDLVSIKIRIIHKHQSTLAVQSTLNCEHFKFWRTQQDTCTFEEHLTISEGSMLQRINSNIQQIKTPDSVAFLILIGCVTN